MTVREIFYKIEVLEVWPTCALSAQIRIENSCAQREATEGDFEGAA